MIKFKKMHGNGNDFIVLENLTQTQSLTKAQIIMIGDRKKGIGFDQLITINPPRKPTHDFYIKFFNTDGSEANMCLNGVRSVGAFIWGENLFPRKSLMLGTKSRAIQVQPTKSKLIKAIIDFPDLIEIPTLEKKFLEKLGVKKAHFIDAGNLHLLIESNKIDSYDLAALCLKIRPRKFFKDTNISLFRKSNEGLLLRTNEAGAGETLSCGSASAAVASFCMGSINKIIVISKGGKISLRTFNGKLEMVGPAEFIYEGRWRKN